MKTTNSVPVGIPNQGHKMTATIRKSGSDWEINIAFDSEQDRPNFGKGWSLVEFGECRTYQGVRGPKGGFSGVIAYYRSRPKQFEHAA